MRVVPSNNSMNPTALRAAVTNACLTGAVAGRTKGPSPNPPLQPIGSADG